MLYDFLFVCFLRGVGREGGVCISKSNQGLLLKRQFKAARMSGLYMLFSFVRETY